MDLLKDRFKQGFSQTLRKISAQIYIRGNILADAAARLEVIDIDTLVPEQNR
jgi:hypothetical protein